MSAGEELESTIEAILFASTEPVSRKRLEQVFERLDAEVVGEALEKVVERYTVDGESRGVFIEEVAGGLRLATRPELHGNLRAYFDISGQNRLSMAALETLAIVAYRQPITGPEIQDLRGVNSSGVLKTLLDRRLVRIAGRKQVVGKPFIYRTTREFLMHFGLAALSDLPPLEEFEESFGALETEVQESLLEGEDPMELAAAGGDANPAQEAANEQEVDSEPAPSDSSPDAPPVDEEPGVTRLEVVEAVDDDPEPGTEADVEDEGDVGVSPTSS